MKPFDLEAVLKYRHRLKDLARTKFMEAQNQYNSVKMLLDDKTNEQAHLIKKLSILQTQGIEIQEHIRYENRIELVTSEIARLRERLKKKQQIVVRERNHLLEKSKEYRVMERLKERRNLAWRQFLEKKDTAMLDEIAVLNKNR